MQAECLTASSWFAIAISFPPGVMQTTPEATQQQILCFSKEVRSAEHMPVVYANKASL